MCKANYKSVLDLIEKFQLKHKEIKEEEGKLFINGFTSHQYEKDLIWDEIKAIGRQYPIDIRADIGVTDKSVYAEHTGKSGESLSKIAQHYYSNLNQYPVIFKVNRDQIKDANIIQPGQLLKIPKL